jgi:F0F1-type ATP synthase assembly protein I
MPSEPPLRGPGWYTRQFAVVMELPFMIVAVVVTGGLFGFLLDRWLHTSPFLMLLLGGMGFYAALRETLRRLDTSKKPVKKNNDGNDRNSDA